MELEMFVYKRYASVSKYTGSGKFLVIPQEYRGVPVTEIRANAFAQNSTLEGVFIPSTLQTIGENAFLNCKNLKYIGCGLDDGTWQNIPALPKEEWPDLEVLTEDELPEMSCFPPSMQIVESSAFAGTGIRNITFNGDAVEIGDAAFEDCQHLKKVVFLNCNRLVLGKRTFMNSSIVRFYAPRVRFDTVPEYAFANCVRLVSVMARITAVGTRAFYHCERLETLNVPKELRSIGKEAFEGCDRLVGVKLPKKRSPRKPQTEVELESGSDLPEDDLLLELEEPDGRKEEEEVNMIDQKIYDGGEPNGLDAPLFRMNINYRGKATKTIPTRIKGCWGGDHSAYYFSIQTPSAFCGVNMQIMTGQEHNNIVPLLNYMVKHSMTVVLLGKQYGTFYTVYEIMPDSASNSKNIALEFFHEVIKRIKRPIPEGANEGEILPSFAMHTKDEYETYIEICRDRIPAWVLQAYNRNKETIRKNTDFSSSEERKHATRAQELLMNIDWLPYVVSIPPAKEVRRILDEEFFGMDAVKDRIMEVVAQIRRTGKLPKHGILLHGPAGVGKTSIAKAIARVFGMPLIQVDLSTMGGEPDEISGSSRIYGNARPGLIVEKMFQIRSSTAILLVNEVDKAGENKSGRCASSVLLSVLDKTGFYENFLEEIIPTDNLFCIGTCNDINDISKPLRDRFLVFDIAGYTRAEKKTIFNEYVLPAERAESNILPEQMDLDEEAVDLLTSEYALEPGARDLEQYCERIIGDYCRYLDEETGGKVKRTYTADDIRELFGPGRKISRQFAVNSGQVNAAFYHNGKAYFFLIEAAIVPGTGKFRAFGPMSKIQEEYCEVAYWCARNTISSAACDFSKCDVAIFVPQRIPDGVSNHVGLGCYTAICSKIMNTNLAINDTCFVGGCDMNGSLYFDENDLTPLLRSMKARGVSTLYAPMGTNRLVNAKANDDCSIMIVEGPDAKTLFSLAVAQSSCKH